MKIRYSYVSNSSSSSFILYNSMVLRNIGLNDWNDMIKELFQDYDKQVEEHKKFLAEYGENKEDPYYPYCVFDILCEPQREEARKELEGYLSGWIASHVVCRNGKFIKVKNNVRKEWKDLCDRTEKEIERLYEKKHGNVYVYIYGYSRESIRKASSVSYWDGDKHRERKLPRKYVNRLESAWDKLGLCDHFAVMNSNVVRFVVHFDENEYMQIKGVTEEQEKGGWETEEYSYDRLCEIFAKWFVEHGRLPVGSDWRTLKENTAAYCMHEG